MSVQPAMSHITYTSRAIISDITDDKEHPYLTNTLRYSITPEDIPKGENNILTILTIGKSFSDADEVEHKGNLFKKILETKFPESQCVVFNLHSYKLAQFIPPTIKKAEFLHSEFKDTIIYADCLETIYIRVNDSQFDHDFFNRLPVSVREIFLHVIIVNHETTAKSIYENGFFDLPPLLDNLVFDITFFRRGVVDCCKFTEAEIEDIKRSFSYAPSLKSIKINGVDYELKA